MTVCKESESLTLVTRDVLIKFFFRPDPDPSRFNIWYFLIQVGYFYLPNCCLNIYLAH